MGCDVLVVSRPLKRRPIKRRLANLVRPFRDPFEEFKHPSDLAPSVPSSKLNELPGMQLSPDLILCCSFHRLIPETVLRMAPVAVNVHAGLLPQRAGGTPNRWAILEGDKETGVTAHLMTGQFDAGDIIWQTRTPIDPNELWGDLELKLTPLVDGAVTFLIRSMLDGEPFGGHPQVPVKQPSYRGLADDKDPRLLTVEEARKVCRATLPKFCGLHICQTRLSQDRCGLLRR